MRDPFEDLHAPVAPLAPSPTFAARLRRRLATALDPEPPDVRTPNPAEPGGTMPTTTSPSRAHVPSRLHTITPYLCCRDARRAINWYGEVFGAEQVSEIIPMGPDDDSIGHVELTIGDSLFMVSDEWPAGGVVSPLSQEGSSIGLVLYVPEVDATFAAALAAGATEVRPVSEQYGARSGWLLDPFGYRWNVGTALPDAAGTGA